VEDSNKEVKLKNICIYPTGVQCAYAHIARRGRKSWSRFHDTTLMAHWRNFLPSNAAKLQLCWTHMCRNMFLLMVNRTCYK